MGEHGNKCEVWEAKKAARRWSWSSSRGIQPTQSDEINTLDNLWTSTNCTRHCRVKITPSIVKYVEWVTSWMGAIDWHCGYLVVSPDWGRGLERENPSIKNDNVLLAVLVAQLVEQSLLTPEIRGSNPDIGEILTTNRTIEKTSIKKKRPGMAHLKKPIFCHLDSWKKPRFEAVDCDTQWPLWWSNG